MLALASATLACASYSLYARDRAARVPAQILAEQYTMPLRRPEIVNSLEYAPSGDFATDLVADATLSDVVLPVSLTNMPAEARAAWIDAVPRYDEQMSRAVGLALDAVTQRPGWPYHASLLGQLVYTRYERALSPELVTTQARWSKPLYQAAAAAESDDALWQSLALAYLQTWPDLGRVHSATSPEVFRHAFQDVTFVRSSLGPAIQIVGKRAVLASLPELPPILWTALQEFGSSGDIETAWTLHQRWDAAEWHARGEDLKKIERAAARRDVEQARELCDKWTSAHSVWDYDSSLAHAQAVRILELWPSDKSGRWTADPRADIVRYFLGYRTADVRGAVLARTADSLAGVPLPIAARIHVLAGDIAGAESIVRSAEGFGSLEWTPYILELTRYWIGQKDKSRARAAFAGLAPAASSECEALAVRRGIEGKETVVSGPRDLSPQVTVGTPIALCIDDATPLRVRLSSATPAIVDYGWDGARDGTVLVSSSSPPLRVVPPQPGMRQLTTRQVVTGGAATIVAHKS